MQTLYRLSSAVTACAVAIIATAIGCDNSKDKTASVAAQDASPSATTSPTLALTRPSSQPGIIQCGDWLRVRINDLVGAGVMSSFFIRVAANGTADLPYIGPVPVAGATSAMAEKKVSDGYNQASVVHDAMISIDRICLAQPGDPLPGPIHKYDLVRVEVFELMGPSSRSAMVKRVAADGTFDTLAAGPVKIEGLTDAGAVHAIADHYESKRIMHSAIVTVTTLEAAPENAGQIDLPDGPIHAVPVPLKALFEQ